ncbi:hypothetical protein DEIPH_ctg055orf0012 [Deinococcus phoenicis]|uniref:Uncharacterized protein n=1 Tax=Deinococcus phoenicis TaxID=1476583 RepID=A0A016QMI9_9DEIO|nr:hypothetical protein [Deinococcus phoenicis]EYB66984.1 hypothetical protein DEIPH_ctg055orf0012 [Deinococcus phoenicis]
MPRPRTAKTAPAALPVTFRAGCGREWAAVSAEPDLAYTEQGFPECPACPHRVEPDGGPPFCTLRPAGSAHPFAALSGLDWPE